MKRFNEAYNYVKNKRNIIKPNEKFMKELQNLK